MGGKRRREGERTEGERRKGETSEPSEKEPYNIVNKDGKNADRTEAEDHKRIDTRILYPDILQKSGLFNAVSDKNTGQECSNREQNISCSEIKHLKDMASSKLYPGKRPVSEGDEHSDEEEDDGHYENPDAARDCEPVRESGDDDL